ncbi:MAG: SOS response-associated peptidase family protein, partial [Protaetiibacter sp.]
AGSPLRELELAMWDWPKPPGRPSGAPIINARLEKLAERFWVGAFSNSRALVPMSGYVEWTGEKGDKQPHYLHGDGLLAAAALTWTVDVDGRRQRVFVVVTREARDASGEVHDRMPAFLEEDLWDQWLSPEPLTVQGRPEESARRRAELLEQLEASSAAIASTIRTRLVDRRINNSRTVDPYDPTIIDPLPA